MRSLLLRTFLVATVALSFGAAGFAQSDDLVSLRADLESRFEVSPLSDGFYLRALDADSGPSAVEVSGSTVAIDGEAVGTDELRARLGDEVATSILALAALGEEERTALLADPEPEMVAEAAEGEAEAMVVEAEETGESEESEDVEMTPEQEEEARAEAEERAEHRRRHRRSHSSSDAEVAFAGNLTVEAGEVTRDVLVFGGRLKVQGRVEGDATVIGGSANIEGEVEGDVTAIGGPVRLEDGSLVEGNVTSVGGRVYREDGARVEGHVENVPFNADFSFGPWTDWRQWQRYGHDSRRFDFNPWGWWTGVGWKLVKILLLAAFAWLSLLVARTPIERMERRIEAEPWKTGLVGLLAQVLFVPTIIILAVFLAISIIGIPLLLVLPFLLLAVLLAGWLGFVAVAGRVGGWAEERFGWKLGNPFWVVLVGLLLIGALSTVGQLLDFGVAPLRFLAAVFLFFGGIVSFAAWTIACGAAVLTRFGTAESWSRADDLVAPLPPVPNLGDPVGPADSAGDPGGDDDSGDDFWDDDLPFDEPELPDGAEAADDVAEEPAAAEAPAEEPVEEDGEPEAEEPADDRDE